MSAGAQGFRFINKSLARPVPRGGSCSQEAPARASAQSASSLCPFLKIQGRVEESAGRRSVFAVKRPILSAMRRALPVLTLILAVAGCSYDLVLLADETRDGGTRDAARPSPLPLLAYEPFDELGVLDGLSGGQGWSGAWELQPVAEAGFVVVETNPLAAAPFPGTSRYLSGGDHYATARRRLDVEGVFSAWRDPADGRLGAAGTELWISALVRRDENAFEQMDVGLTRGGFGPRLQVYRFGYNHRDGFWSVTLGTDERALTTRPAVPEERLLWVVHFRFDAPQATVETFLMDELQSEPIPVHAARWPRSELTFDHIALGHGAFPGEGSTDEVRVGAHLEAVLPR